MARKQTGFTLLELLTTMVVAAVLLGIAIPTFAVWLPNYRLKNAALDVFSNFQQAKMMAVRANDSHSLVFDPGNNRYEIQDSGGGVVKSVSLDQYGDPGEVTFGGGDATKDATTFGGGLPGDGVSYGSETVTFNARGLGNAGYVYLENAKGTAYALGTESSGLIKMRKWNGSANTWE
jgi:prepilin-type N-terminal cleavage/methylation domain-containing protein